MSYTINKIDKIRTIYYILRNSVVNAKMKVADNNNFVSSRSYIPKWICVGFGAGAVAAEALAVKRVVAKKYASIDLNAFFMLFPLSFV